MKNPDLYNQELKDLNSDSCDCNYCFYRLILTHLHIDRRTLIQIKCIEKFKFEESEKEGRDIGQYNAEIRWVTEGWASRYADAYSEDKSFSEIYKQTREKH